MNVFALASDIVTRVHKSPDSAVNLEVVVAGLIRAEQERDLEASRNEARQAYQQRERDRQITLSQAIDEANSLLRNFARDFAPK